LLLHHTGGDLLDFGSKLLNPHAFRPFASNEE
jgi:hypothetical protein